jgi:hypothetical protein
MSLNSLSARKKQHSAHNSPRVVARLQEGEDAAAEEQLTEPAAPGGGSLLASSVAAPPNAADVAHVTSLVAEAAARGRSNSSVARELFADGGASRGGASDWAGGDAARVTVTGPPATATIPATTTTDKLLSRSPSYQERLESRVTRPTLYRPSSRPKVKPPGQVDRDAHHIAVGGRGTSSATPGSGSSSAGQPGSESAEDHKGNHNGHGNGNGNGADSSSSDTKGEVSFLSSMSLRIKSLEAANRGLRMAVVDKEKQCLRLQQQVTEGAANKDEQLHSLRAELDAARAHSEHLEGDNARLRREVAEFHEFLQDYGLQWCGNSSSSSSSSSDYTSSNGIGGTPAAGSDGSAAAAPPSGAVGSAAGTPSGALSFASSPVVPLEPLQVDFDLVFAALTNLNQVAAEDNQRKVTVVGKRAVFASEKPVQLTFYSDGFVVGDDAADRVGSVLVGGGWQERAIRCTVCAVADLQRSMMWPPRRRLAAARLAGSVVCWCRRKHQGDVAVVVAAAAAITAAAVAALLWCSRLLAN